MQTQMRKTMIASTATITKRPPQVMTRSASLSMKRTERLVVLGR